MDFKLYKDNNRKVLAGVCGGLANELHIDPTIVRIITALLCIYLPVLILVYIVLALVLPDRREVERERNGEPRSQRPNPARPGSESQNAEGMQNAAYASSEAKVRVDLSKEEEAPRQEGPKTGGFSYDASYEANANRQSETSAGDSNNSRPDAGAYSAAPSHSSRTANVTIAVILICAGIGLFITRVIFNYPIRFYDFFTFITLGLGIFLIVSGIMENRANHSIRVTKLVAGALLAFLSIIWLLNIFGIAILTFSQLISAVRFLWPLFVIALGLNILLPNKKAATIIWLSVFAVILIYAVYTNFVGGNLYYWF